MDRPVTHPILPLVEALFDGTIDGVEFTRLNAALRDDAEARAFYLSMVNFHASLPGVVGQPPQLSVQLMDGDDGEALIEPREMSHLQLMGLLMQVEEKGRAIDPMALAASRSSAEPATGPSELDWPMVGRYVLKQSFGRLASAKGLAVAAAVMLLAAVLVLTQLGSEPELAVDPPRVDPPVAAVVATLTGERHAVWRAESGTLLPAVGDGLVEGRRLSLVEGFAEIRTNRGAAVILEGPASIEFFADDNMVYLHDGRLVGRCETPSSKGFVVKTDRAIVTDLGTEFGVAVTPEGATQAAVFTGEIELGVVDGVDDGSELGRSVRLTEGWASSVTGQGRLAEEVTPVGDEIEARFAKSLNEVDEPSFVYRRAVMALEPRLYWSFESEPGQPIVDLMGYPASVGQTEGAAATVVPGVFGLGVAVGRLAGPSTCLVSVGEVLGEGERAYTINLWVKPDRVHHGRIAALVGVEGDVDTSKSHLCAVELLGDQQWLDQNPLYASASPASIRFLHRDPLAQGPGRNAYTTQGYEPGQWMLLTVVKSATQIQIYRNGELAAESPDTQAVSGPMRLALASLLQEHANDGNARPFAGVMDEVSVFGQALSPEQIKGLFEMGVAGLEGDQQ